MKILDRISNWDNLYIEGYAIFLFLLGLFFPWIWVVFLFYLFGLRKRIRVMLLIIVISIILILFFRFTTQKIPETIKGQASVVDIINYTYSDQITIRIDNQKFNIKVGRDDYQLGDIIYIHGKINVYKKKTIPYGFNQQQFHYSKNVLGYVSIYEIEKVGEKSTFYSLRDQISQNLSTRQSNTYLKSLILGEKSYNNDQNNLFRELNIIYLFTVSGLHLYALILLCKKVFFYLSFSQEKQDFFECLIYVVFIYLNAFSLGVLRLGLMFVFRWINHRFELNFTKIDILQIVFFLMLFFQIHLIFHLGFLITYLILNTIYLMEFRYQRHTGYLKRLLITSIIYLVVLPFNLEFSLLMIILLPAIVFFVSTPLFILAISTFLFRVLDPYFSQLTVLFEYVLIIINGKNVNFQLPALNIYMIVLYYIIIIYFFRSKTIKDGLLRFTLVPLLFFIVALEFQQHDKIYFLDVDQGDSTFISSNRCSIVIDSYQHVLSFLQNHGVYEIDYLILSHADLDHTKEAQDLIDQLQIKAVVLSLYDDYDIKHPNKLYVKSGDQLSCGSLKLNILGPIKEYGSSNSNSIVLQTRINQKTYLFTGDIESDAEQDLIDTFGYQLKSDILKVSHHGSSTSTTETFLSYVDPDIAVISLGYNNRYGFPSQEVIERLLRYQVIIYRTDVHGTILNQDSKKKSKWFIHLPF